MLEGGVVGGVAGEAVGGEGARGGRTVDEANGAGCWLWGGREAGSGGRDGEVGGGVGLGGVVVSVYERGGARQGTGGG